MRPQFDRKWRVPKQTIDAIAGGSEAVVGQVRVTDLSALVFDHEYGVTLA
jgi:hypothetical protein